VERLFIHSALGQVVWKWGHRSSPS